MVRKLFIHSSARSLVILVSTAKPRWLLGDRRRKKERGHSKTASKTRCLFHSLPDSMTKESTALSRLHPAVKLRGFCVRGAEPFPVFRASKRDIFPSNVIIRLVCSCSGAIFSSERFQRQPGFTMRGECLNPEKQRYHDLPVTSRERNDKVQ